MFDYKEISRILGKYLAAFSLLILIPLAAAAYFEFVAPSSHPQPHSTFAFLWTLLICAAVSGLLLFAGRNSSKQLERRESILLVVCIWILTAILSGIPFYLSGTLNPIDAYFEAMSGLTTTGSTMISPKTFHPETGQETTLYYTNPHVPNKTYSIRGTVDPVRDPETGLILFSGVEAVGKAILLGGAFFNGLEAWASSSSSSQSFRLSESEENSSTKWRRPARSKTGSVPA